MSDSWISWNPRIDEPSKPEAVLEDVLGELVRRDREVLHQPGQVAEPDVDDLDALVLDQLQDVARESPRCNLLSFRIDEARVARASEIVAHEPGSCRARIVSAARCRPCR